MGESMQIFSTNIRMYIEMYRNTKKCFEKIYIQLDL